MTTPELEDFRTELIQTAAVIVSAIEDIDYGVANSLAPVADNSFRDQAAAVMWEVREERIRQDEKWGPQHHRMADWLAIIGEEFGEACMAYVDDLLMPTILEQKRIGSNQIGRQVESYPTVPPVQWHLPGFVKAKIVETDIEAHDDLEGLFDRLRKEADEDDDLFDPNEGRFERQD